MNVYILVWHTEAGRAGGVPCSAPIAGTSLEDVKHVANNVAGALKWRQNSAGVWTAYYKDGYYRIDSVMVHEAQGV